MLGKNSQLNGAQAHKQLLIAESEMHRVLLIQDGQAIVAEVRELGDKTAQIYHTVSHAVGTVSALTSFFPGKNGEESEGKPSFFKKLMHGVKVGTSIWQSFKNGRE